MLVGHVQHSLVCCHESEHDGEFVFVCCRRGLQKYLGRRLKLGERVYFDVVLREAKDDRVENMEPPSGSVY